MTLESQIPPTILALTFMIEYRKCSVHVQCELTWVVRESASLFGSTLEGIQSKFYVVGLMYALNARFNLKRGDSDDEVSLLCFYSPIQANE